MLILLMRCPDSADRSQGRSYLGSIRLCERRPGWLDRSKRRMRARLHLRTRGGGMQKAVLRLLEHLDPNRGVRAESQMRSDVSD